MAQINSKFNNSWKKQTIGHLLAILILACVFSINNAKASDISAENVIKLVNDARTSENVGVLIENPELMAAAESKAQDMIDHDYFAHVSPAGKTPWDWINAQGYDYRYAGENLAINFTDAQDQQQAWMNSPLHRKNILNPDYKEIGVAVKSGVIEGHQTIVTVQEFGTQMAQAMAEDYAKNEILQSKAVVAGVSVTKAAPTVTIVTPPSANITSETKKGEIISNGRFTALGWLSMLVLAIILTVVDVLALAYKKHAEMFVLPSPSDNNI